MYFPVNFAKFWKQIFYRTIKVVASDPRNFIQYTISKHETFPETALNKKFFIKVFFSKVAAAKSAANSVTFTKKSLMENFIFCAVLVSLFWSIKKIYDNFTKIYKVKDS